MADKKKAETLPRGVSGAGEKEKKKKTRKNTQKPSSKIEQNDRSLSKKSTTTTTTTTTSTCRSKDEHQKDPKDVQKDVPKDPKDQKDVVQKDQKDQKDQRKDQLKEPRSLNTARSEESRKSQSSESEQRSAEMRTAADGTADDPKIANLGEFILKEIRSLEGVSYYHGMMSRDAVERTLTRVGDFLVRATDNRIMEFEFILSIYNPKRIFSHLIISRDLERKVWWLNVMEQYQLQKTFPSILALCQHYMEKPMGAYRFRLLRAISKGKHLLANDRVHYSEAGLIGIGNFGKVYKGQLDVERGRVVVALKNSKLINDAIDVKKTANANKLKKELMQEAAVMSQLRHVNVVAFFGLAADVVPALIAVEFCEGGSLLGHLQETKTNYSDKMLYVLDASFGLKYLHSLSITHRDLASRNCLICVNGFVKLADFGMGSKCKKVEDMVLSKAGEPCPARWMAPEALMPKAQFLPASDMWALGTLGYEIFANGEPPHPELENSEVMAKVKAGKFPIIPETAGEFMCKLFAQVFPFEPSVRLSAEQFNVQLREYCELNQVISLNNLAINNEKKGIRRTRLYHWDGYVPQVRIDENGKDLGYQDAPSDLIANVVWRGKDDVPAVTAASPAPVVV